MKNIEATFRIVTPLFIGDADQDVNDGIRPPSIKGALRFWWRALNWARIRENSADDVQALKSLHNEEAYIFGSAADNNAQRINGQARFSMKVMDYTQRCSASWENLGHVYLLGQGLAKPNGECVRNALSPGGTFTVQLRFRPYITKNPDTGKEQQRQLISALFAWGLLGGLGSRSRRGIGSIAIESVTGAESLPGIPVNVEQYQTALKSLGLPANCSLPPFSAFSQHTRLDISAVGNDARALLNKIGLEMMRYRGWGFRNPHSGNYKVAGVPAEQNFPSDHHNMLAAIKGHPPMLLPERAIFGLPHNYFFKSEFDQLNQQRLNSLLQTGLPEDRAKKKAGGWAKERAKAEIAPAIKDQARRASPLLIHVHQFSDNSVAIVQTLIPALFLPSGSKVEVKANRLPNGSTLVPVGSNCNIIRTYLDRFTDRTVVFPGKVVP